MAQTEQRQVEIIIKGQKAEASLKDMEAAIAVLNNQLRKLPANSQEFIEKSKELNQVRQRYTDIRNEAKSLGDSTSMLTKLISGNFSMLGGVIAGSVIGALMTAVNWLMNFGSKASELARTYSDAFADIQKTTDMSNQEVRRLNDSLGELDTRTSQLELLEIAKIGGQIGIAADEMDGFVASVDKAVVALGDEFAGGAEEVATKLGKIDNLFKQNALFKDENGEMVATGQRLTMLGSALNELGAAGVATAPFLTDFTQRVAGLGALAPQIDQTMGLAAALEELGETAENAASGTKNILQTAAKNIPDFANQVGMGAKEFQNLLNNNPNEALLRLADSFKGMAPTDVAVRLKSLGITSLEASGVMTKLANNTELVRQRQMLASKAIQEGTSLQNEFNIKNNTDAGIQDKRRKEWERITLTIGQGVVPVMSLLQDIGIGLANVLGSVFGEIAPLLQSFFNEMGRFARSLGFATDKGSALATILNAVGAALRLALVPLRITFTVITAIVGAFNYAYQSSSLFRGAINALLAPLRFTIEAIKQVVGWVNKLADTAKKEVKVKATVETQKKTTTTTTSTNTATTIATTAAQPAAGDAGGELDKILAKEQEKEQKKAAAAQKAAEKRKQDAEKHEAEMEKLREDFRQKSLEADRAAEALRDSMESSRLGKLTAAHSKEIAAIEAKERAVKANTAVREEQKAALLAKYAEQRLMIDKKYFDDKADLEEEERGKEREKKMQQIEADTQEALLKKENEILQAEIDKQAQDELVAQNLFAALEAEQAKEDALYAIRRQGLENKLALLVADGQGETAEAQRIRNQMLQLEKQHQEKKTELVKKGRDARMAIEKFGLGFAKDAIEAGIQLLSKDEAARKKNAQLIKAFSMGKVLVNMYEEISGAWRASNTPANPLMLVPGGPAIYGVAMTALATARGALAIRNINSQQFAAGGFTGGGTGPRDSTGFRVAGVVHEGEYVAPKWMVESPRYANVIRYLEAERTRSRGYAAGGMVSAPPMPVPASEQAGRTEMMLAELVAEQRATRQALAAWPRELRVVNNVVETEAQIKMLNQLRSDAGM